MTPICIQNLEILYLIIYVDDVLIAGDDIHTIENLKRNLNSIFEMSDCGILQYYLGTKIEYDRQNGIMKLSQHSNIDRILKRFSMSECNPSKTPMEKGLCLPQNTSNESTKMLGSLMFLMLSVRPDICYQIGYMGRFQNNLSDIHWSILKRIVRYQRFQKFLTYLHKQFR